MTIVLLFILLIAHANLAASCPLPGSSDATDDHIGDRPAIARSSVRSLAEQGDANAQWLLASELFSGGDGSLDVADGIRWLRRAADQGHSLAQRDLGIRYELGDGVGIDLTEAFFWYALASRRDSGRARVRRDALVSALTKEQLDTVTERLARWRPIHHVSP